MKPKLLFLILPGLLLGLPLLGLLLFGAPLERYLEFPPRTRYVQHAPFSMPIFVGLAIVILAVMLPFIYQIFRTSFRARTGAADDVCPDGEASDPPVRRPLPWWGWVALVLCGHFWILAWTRQAWFAPFQAYTFIPLWVCLIVFFNAMTWCRTGRCRMTHETAFFLLLFPVSAAFWWFFEYLNRFVQNWFYLGTARFSPTEYFITASLSFSTVLPAVWSVKEWLDAHPRSAAGLDRFIPVRLPASHAFFWSVLTAASTGLLLIGRWPNLLFPLLWTAPLLILIALNALAGRPPFFPELRDGDWRRVFRYALAALICGFFWELWNWHSLAKWIYDVPCVDRFHLFEMPILGYAGYLPFGLECAVIIDLLHSRSRKS